MRLLAGFVLFLLISACASSGGGGMRPVDANRLDPETITVRVQTALLNAPNVHANEVTVSVQGTVVTLDGAVHNQQEIDGAIAAAKSVAGVTEVRSNLKTMPSESPSDPIGD